MDTMAYIAFGFYTIICLGGALWAVTRRSLVRAFAGLVTSLLGVAGLYFLLAAPFIGLMQILIYVGAVAVLIFFAIVITGASREAQERITTTKKKRCLAVLAGLIPASFLAMAITKYSLVTNNTPPQVSMEDLGRALLGPYGLVFELISVVLFAAMAGAVLLGFKRRQ
ncbi:MAG: NADH-quinone oxidoreductase subunit J [Desulfoplanes sp.]|nr:NADH-quinone oxidoreductase subunit J [Desulfoplanes sp.]